MWEAACRYSARLVSSGDPLLALGSSFDFATVAVSESLESDWDVHKIQLLGTAAEMFRWAAPELLRRCREGCARGMHDSEHSVWDGERGYSMARWRLWKQK